MLQGLQTRRSCALGKENKKKDDSFKFCFLILFLCPFNCFHLRKQNCYVVWKFGSISTINWKTCYCPGHQGICPSPPVDEEENSEKKLKAWVYWIKGQHPWDAVEEKCDNLPERQTEGGCTKMESLSPSSSLSLPRWPWGNAWGVPSSLLGALCQVVRLERSVKAT